MTTVILKPNLPYMQLTFETAKKQSSFYDTTQSTLLNSTCGLIAVLSYSF